MNWPHKRSVHSLQSRKVVPSLSSCVLVLSDSTCSHSQYRNPACCSLARQPLPSAVGLWWQTVQAGRDDSVNVVLCLHLTEHNLPGHETVLQATIPPNLLQTLPTALAKQDVQRQRPVATGVGRQESLVWRRLLQLRELNSQVRRGTRPV